MRSCPKAIRQLPHFLLVSVVWNRPLKPATRTLFGYWRIVVDLLIAKGLILFTDLPVDAQQKIMHRQQMRYELGSRLDLIEED